MNTQQKKIKIEPVLKILHQKTYNTYYYILSYITLASYAEILLTCHPIFPPQETSTFFQLTNLRLTVHSFYSPPSPSVLRFTGI